MVKKLIIFNYILILFCIFPAVNSGQNIYAGIYDLKKALIDCDNHTIFRGLLVKRNFRGRKNKIAIGKKKEEEDKKNRMGKLLKNFNQIMI